MAAFRPWARSTPENEVRPGSRYRRQIGRSLMQTATVIGLRPDLSGIVHVQFAVTIDGLPAGASDNHRILALRSFVNMYRERMS